MSKITLHLIRHAQGYHNLNTANHSLPDPSLTPLGELQCHILSTALPPSISDHITHLVASPLRRTIYTTLLSFPSQVSSGMKILALPSIQETSDLPCDTGSAVEKLEAEFNPGGEEDGKVDLSLVREEGKGWNSKTGKYAPNATANESRAREARLFLRSLAASSEQAQKGEDVNIAVVTHGGFLHYFTDDWDGHERFTGTGWANTEFRSYNFVEGGEGEEGAGMQETRESRERRRGKEIPLTRDEQRELRASAEREWGESGFQFNGGKQKEKEGESAKL